MARHLKLFTGRTNNSLKFLKTLVASSPDPSYLNHSHLQSQRAFFVLHCYAKPTTSENIPQSQVQDLSSRVPLMSCCHGNHSIYQPIRRAGHSHWQNIRHIKGAADAQRQKHSVRIRQKIQQAIKSGGGGDPKLNRELARVLEQGKALNLTLSSMMDSVKKVTESKDEGTDLILEAMSVYSNFFMIIECYTDKPAHARKEIRLAMEKKGGSIQAGGRAATMFDHKGVIYVTGTEDYSLDLDNATEQAIEAGAEEVIEAEDCSGENKVPCLKFLCETRQLHQVKTALIDMGVPVSDSRFEFIPHTFVKVKKDKLGMAEDLLSVIEEHADVVRVYDNIEVDEDS